MISDLVSSSCLDKSRVSSLMFRVSLQGFGLLEKEIKELAKKINDLCGNVSLYESAYYVYF